MKRQFRFLLGLRSINITHKRGSGGRRRVSRRHAEGLDIVALTVKLLNLKHVPSIFYDIVQDAEEFVDFQSTRLEQRTGIVSQMHA